MSYTLDDVAPHQIPLVRFKNEAPDASKLKANSVILDSFSVAGKTYLKIVVDGALLDPIATLEATIATLKGNPSVDFDSLEKIEGKINGIQTILNSNDVNLDTVQELVDAIKTVETSLSTILINDLTTGGTTKALTAEMGKSLKGMIDALTSVVNALVVNTLAGNESDKAPSVAAVNSGLSAVNSTLSTLFTPYEI